MTIYQIAVLLYLIFYYGLLLGLRSYILYKRIGKNALKYENTGPAAYNEWVIGFCAILVSIIGLNYVFLPANYEYYLVPLTYLETDLLKNIGVILSFVGLLLGFIAQLQMKDSWRIGIHADDETELVTHGFFRYSRNPIYMFLGISYIGFFLLLPNALSLAFVLLTYTSIGMKIRFEEEFMEQKFPVAFKAYRKKVRRWI